MTVPGWTELRGDQTPPLYTGAGVPRSLHPPPPTPHRVTGGGGGGDDEGVGKRQTFCLKIKA